MAEKLEILVVAKDQASGVLKGISGAFGDIFKTAMGFLSAQVFSKIGDAAVSFAKDSFNGALEAQKGIEALSASIKRLGDNAPITFEAAKELADQFKDLVGGSDDVVLAMANVGLRFDKIGKDIFPRFIEQSADLGTVLKMEPTRAAELLGKVLQDLGTDGVGSIGRLKAAGIQLTDSQEEQIKTLVASGKVTEAQTVLMDALAKSTGGAAKVAAGTAEGQWKIFKETIADAGEGIALMFLPRITEATKFLNTTFSPVISTIVKQFEIWFGFFENGGTLKNFFSIFEDGSSYVKSFLESLGIAEETASSMADAINSVANSVVSFITNSLDFLSNWWIINGPGITEAANTLFGGMQTMINELSARFGPFIEQTFAKLAAWMLDNGPLIQQTLQTIATFFSENVVPVIVAAMDIIMPLLTGLLDILMNLGTLVMQVINGDWAGAWATAQTILFTALDAIGASVLTFLNYIASLFGTSLAGIYQTWSENWQLFVEIVGKIKDIILEKVSEFAQLGADIASSFINGIIDGITSAASSVANAVASILPNSGGGGGIQHRAAGGPVSGGTPYMVGERGPELFVPSSGGRIVSNNALAGAGGGMTLNIFADTIIGDKAHVQSYLLPIIREGVKQVSAGR